MDSCAAACSKLVWFYDPREDLSSTMQTKACPRSIQHLPVTALPEHMDKAVVFQGRGSLSSATVSSVAILPTQHLPELQLFLFTEHPQDRLGWASWARTTLNWPYEATAIPQEGRSLWVLSTQENNQWYFLPRWAVSGSSTAWVLRLWGRVLIYWVHYLLKSKLWLLCFIILLSSFKLIYEITSQNAMGISPTCAQNIISFLTLLLFQDHYKKYTDKPCQNEKTILKNRKQKCRKIRSLNCLHSSLTLKQNTLLSKESSASKQVQHLVLL